MDMSKSKHKQSHKGNNLISLGISSHVPRDQSQGKIKRTVVEHEMRFKKKVTLMNKHKFNPYFAISEAESDLEKSIIFSIYNKSIVGGMRSSGKEIQERWSSVMRQRHDVDNANWARDNKIAYRAFTNKTRSLSAQHRQLVTQKRESSIGRDESIGSRSSF